VLLDAVRDGSCEVVVKCHPQQNHGVERARLARRAGRQWNRGLSIAAPDADTRGLILGADCVVGFQTTAIYEAVAASRPVVVAAWGDAYDRLRAGLIPFHDAPPECVRQARSAVQLATLLAEECVAPSSSACAAWYEEALGPVDGGATDRVAARLRQIAADWRPTGESRLLERHRRSHAFGLLVRSFAAEAVWTAAVPAARLAGQQRRVAARRRRAREGRWMAMTTIHGG
jgi:hypothetical protein